jgi:hypothetical protein
LYADGAKITAEAIKVKCAIAVVFITFPGNLADGSTAVVCYYTQDMWAISSVNILGNNTGVEQAQKLTNILQVKEKLTTLCGFSGDETELDLSNTGLSAGCAVLVANEIGDMGALTKLDISNNNIEQGEALQGVTDLCNTQGIAISSTQIPSDY